MAGTLLRLMHTRLYCFITTNLTDPKGNILQIYSLSLFVFLKMPFNLCSL